MPAFGEFIKTDDTLPSSFSITHPGSKVVRGDLILALTRPYISTGLKISRCPDSYDGALLNQRVVAIRPVCKEVEREFLFCFMRSNFVLNGFQKEFKDKGQQPNLKLSHVKHLLCPLPPPSEQLVITERVVTLIAACDELQDKLTQSLSNADNLLHEVLQEMIAPLNYETL